MPLLPTIQPQVIVPEARGKAAAFDRWLAQGGKPGRSGKFHKGPMKGMTYDQAHQKFQGMWSGASDTIKDKYAARAGGVNDLAPSERAAYGMAPKTAAGAPVPKSAAEQKASRMSYYKRIGMAPPATPATPAPPPAKGDLSKQAMGTPEQQAQVAAMMNEGGKYGTATVGNYLDMQSAVAAERGDLAGVSREIEQKKAAEAAAAEKAKFDSDIAAAEQRRNAARQAAGIAPTTAPVQSPAAAPSSGVAGMPTDERMHAQGKVNGGPTPVVKAPPTPAALPTVSKPSAPTGATVLPKPGKGLDSAVADTNGTLRRVNSLTGLPMGYMPGDALPSGADSAMKERAAASVERQKTAPVITAGAPRAVPVVQPTPSFAQRMRVTPGPKIANPDDPKKFFTGRVLPLDQLVKR